MKAPSIYEFGTIPPKGLFQIMFRVWLQNTAIFLKYK